MRGIGQYALTMAFNVIITIERCDLMSTSYCKLVPEKRLPVSMTIVRKQSIRKLQLIRITIDYYAFAWKLYIETL